MLYQVTKANNLFNVGDTVEVVRKSARGSGWSSV